MKRYICGSLLFMGTVGVLAAGSPKSMASPPDTSVERAIRWRGPDDTFLPFTEDEEALEFLRTARIIATKELSMGKNRPLKVKLEKDGVRANAIFRTVNLKRSHVKMNGKTYREFYDQSVNECAAYEMSRLLEIDKVPPCVPRSYGGRDGTLQLWIESAKTLKHLVDEGNASTTSRYWVRQLQAMRIFDALIYNFDRNQGNMLFDSYGKLWFIDHTRSFLPSPEIAELEQIVWCERKMWAKLRNLDKDLVSDLLGSYLDYRQISSMIKRRDKLVDHLKRLISVRGEQAVLFDEIPVSNGKIMTSEM